MVLDDLGISSISSAALAGSLDAMRSRSIIKRGMRFIMFDSARMDANSVRASDSDGAGPARLSKWSTAPSIATPYSLSARWRLTSTRASSGSKPAIDPTDIEISLSRSGSSSSNEGSSWKTSGYAYNASRTIRSATPLSSGCSRADRIAPAPSAASQAIIARRTARSRSSPDCCNADSSRVRGSGDGATSGAVGGCAVPGPAAGSSGATAITGSGPGAVARPTKNAAATAAKAVTAIANARMGKSPSPRSASMMLPGIRCFQAVPATSPGGAAEPHRQRRNFPLEGSRSAL